MKLAYGITYACQSFGIHDLHGQIPNVSGSTPVTSDFSNNFSEANSYLNRMRDC